jgi:hypothetical protein
MDKKQKCSVSITRINNLHIQGGDKMKVIIFKENQSIGYISWEADEDFSEIKGWVFELSKMTAVNIELIEDIRLSVRSKILLSGVAGAVWQWVIDHYPSAKPEAVNMIKFLITEED